MTGSALANRHLRAMKIAQWQPRPVLPPARMLQNPAQPVAWVVVEGEDGLQLSADNPAGDLLQKILVATKHDPSAFAICVAGQRQPQAPAGLPQIWFSQTPRPAGPQRLVLPSLAAMLADDQQKRQAWELLKPWTATL